MKGGNRSRWQKKEGKQQNGKRRKEKGIKELRLINDFENLSESQPQTSTREEKFIFLPVFYRLRRLSG
jgi:hypothetical protein